MSNTKHARERFKVLDQCLRDTTRQYSANDLLEKVNKRLSEWQGEGAERSTIGKVQLHEDLKYIENELDAEISKRKSPSDGRVTLYKYRDPSFSISKLPLTKDEATGIQYAIEVLSRFQGLPQFEILHELIPALQEKFGSNRDKPKESIEFSSNKDLVGLQHLTPIYNAIINERVVKITYQDFRSAVPYDITIHPYFLKQYNNRWFLFGRNEKLEVESWTLPLDRIKEIEETTIVFKSTTIEWNEYFDDIIGVTKKAAHVEVIELLFTPEQAPYILTKPIHLSQRKKYNDERGLLISIEVIPNFELEKLLLSFGEKVEVLQPAALKETIQKRLNKAINNYLV